MSRISICELLEWQAAGRTFSLLMCAEPAFGLPMPQCAVAWSRGCLHREGSGATGRASDCLLR